MLLTYRKNGYAVHCRSDDDVNDNPKQSVGRSSRATRIGAALMTMRLKQQPLETLRSSSSAGSNRYQHHLPSDFLPRPTPTNLSNTLTHLNDKVKGVSSTSRGGVGDGSGRYARQLEPATSDEYSRYTRRLSTDDDDDRAGDGYMHQLDDYHSTVNSTQLGRACFNGKSHRYPNEFGRGPSTLLRGDTNGREFHGGGAADNVVTGDERNSDGYTRHLSQNDDEDDDTQKDAPAAGLQLRPGRFGGISHRYRNEFGRGLSTVLSRNSKVGDGLVTSNEVGTVSRQGDGNTAAAATTAAASSQQGNGGGGSGSVLEAVRNWGRQLNWRWPVRRAGDEQVELSQWPRDVEQGHESSPQNKQSGSDGASDQNSVTEDRYVRQLESASTVDDQ